MPIAAWGWSPVGREQGAIAAEDIAERSPPLAGALRDVGSLRRILSARSLGEAELSFAPDAWRSDFVRMGPEWRRSGLLPDLLCRLGSCDYRAIVSCLAVNGGEIMYRLDGVKMDHWLGGRLSP